MTKTPEKKAEENIDEMFCQTFETNNPAMHDWARIKMELKKSRQARREGYKKGVEDAAKLCDDAQSSCRMNDTFKSVGLSIRQLKYKE